MFPVITKPTRIAKDTSGETKSQTLIDLIFTNDIYSKFTSGIIQIDLSDHYPVFYVKHKNNEDKSETPEFTNDKNYYEKRIINEETTKPLLNALKRTDWSFLNGINDTNAKYNAFVDNIQSLMEKYIPVKKVYRDCKKVKKVRNMPWITKGLTISCHNKNKLFTKQLEDSNPVLYQLYKKYRNVLEATKRKSKRLYY